MAITAQRAFAGGAAERRESSGGRPVIEHGMVEEDFRVAAEAGVSFVGRSGAWQR